MSHTNCSFINTGRLLCEMLLGDRFQEVLVGELMTEVHQGWCFCTKVAFETGLCLYGKPINGWKKLAPLAERYEGQDF